MLHSNTPQVKEQAALTTRSSSLRHILVAELYTEEQYSKTGKAKPRKHLPRSNLSWNTRKEFFKILSLWEAAQETERRCFPTVFVESNATPRISRSSNSFSTVLLNEGDWGYIVGDLETIVVSILVASNFVPHRSHHTLTLPKSRFMNSATATLTLSDGHNSFQSAVMAITDQLILQNGKKLRGVKEEQ